MTLYQLIFLTHCADKKIKSVGNAFVFLTSKGYEITLNKSLLEIGWVSGNMSILRGNYDLLGNKWRYRLGYIERGGLGKRTGSKK